MFLVKKTNKGIYSIPIREIDVKGIRAMSSPLSQKILSELAKQPSYPRQIAKNLGEHEQKIYYHIRNLEKSGIIEQTAIKIIEGASARIYSLKEESFAVKFKDFKETSKFPYESSSARFLEPFVEDGRLNCQIIVGSPDPHGIEKARSRDGYYGIDFALFLGTFLSYIPSLNVKLDTEVHQEDLEKNLILFGGPVVNTITDKVNSKLPVRFLKDKNNMIFSSVTEKEYPSDETGIIVKAKNPFNKKRSVLVLAGKRYAGTRAVIISFLRYFNEIVKGNKYNEKVLAKVVEGIDMDSDGIVDDVQILE